MHIPSIQAMTGTYFSGARYLMVKYMAPSQHVRVELFFQITGHHARTGSRIGRGDLRDGQGKTHGTDASNKPTPDGSGGASGIEGVGVGRHHRAVETGDAQGKAEGRPETKLSLEDLILYSECSQTTASRWLVAVLASGQVDSQVYSP